MKREYLAAFLFLLPNIIGFIFLSLLPTFASFCISFLKWGLLNTPTFTGLSNYTEMLKDSVFWISLKNTAIYSFIKVPGDSFK